VVLKPTKRAREKGADIVMESIALIENWQETHFLSYTVLSVEVLYWSKNRKRNRK
jgi:hypothetical protein